MLWYKELLNYFQEITGLFSFKMCLCRGSENQVNADKKNKNEAQRQKEQEKKDQKERQKKENELRKNFQVTFVLQENVPAYKAEFLFAIWQFCVFLCVFGVLSQKNTFLKLTLKPKLKGKKSNIAPTGKNIMKSC